MNARRDPNETADLPAAPAESVCEVAAFPTGHCRGSAGSDGAQPAAPEADVPAVPGYRVLGEIARGGMGRVLTAHDLTLDRRVALKILLPGANADRFVRESKITARLPHPGIPPVHALGVLADGSPFLAMKLIAGRTLADEMKTFDRPRLLQAFTQVCQAVGFAHSRGVIHRDLKPANIMVGAFGEVQVMDWGLAKDLTSQQTDDELRSVETRPVILDSSGPAQTVDHSAAGESTADRTRAGTVLGTPAYMAPEQARGEAIDARADVFALGGILCAILTGQPPFRAKSAHEVIQRAAAADLAETHARLDGCGADAELIALCRRCLGPIPADRPADGQAVADGLTAYLDSVQQRLQAAERERAVAVVRASEEQKRREVEQAKAQTERQKRRLTFALAAAVLVLVLGGAGVGWWQLSEETRQAEERIAREAEELKRAAQLALDEAKREAEARQRKTELATRQEYLKKESTAGLDEAEKLRRDLHSQLLDPQQVHVLLSDLNQWRTRIHTAQAAWKRAKSLVESEPALLQSSLERVQRLNKQLQADLEDHQFVRRLDAIPQEAMLQDFNPRQAIASFAKVFPDAGYDVENGDVKEVAAKIRQAPIRYALVAALDQWGTMVFRADKKFPARLMAVARAADPDPWRDAFRQAKMWEDRAALKQLVKEVDPKQHSPQILLSLYNCLLDPVDKDAADMARRALIRYPKDYSLYYTLGYSLRDVGCLQAALALRPDSAIAHFRLGFTLATEPPRAIWHYEKALELRDDFGEAHNNLGYWLSQKKDLNDRLRAVTHLRKALAIERSYDPPRMVYDGRTGTTYRKDVTTRNNLNLLYVRMYHEGDCRDCRKDLPRRRT